MSTNASTEAGIAAAQRLDALVAAMIRSRRMRDLWGDDYERDRIIALALLHDLGLDVIGSVWDSGAGALHVRVRRGELDYKTAYEALRIACGDSLIVLAHDSTGAAEAVRSRLAQAMESTPERKPDSAPYLDLRERRELPDALMRARAEEEKP